MHNIPRIYNDPIIFRRRRGNPLSPFEEIKESMTVESYRVLLTEIPNRLNRVKISYRGKLMHETEDGFLDENTFRVTYEDGTIYFHESMEGKTIQIEYFGEGVLLFPDSRVYHTSDERFPTVKDKFIDVDRDILVQRNRVDTLIRENPQPSEVVDMRIDYNGKVFNVARDRIDAEQYKIEEAYVDAKNKKWPSLKARIDSLQLATEEEFNEKDDEMTNIWARIDLIPGEITLETGRIEKKFDTEVRKITSRIDMVPEQITLKVEEIREWSEGQFSVNYSQIKQLSDELELKVDADGVVNAINLSPKGTSITGNKLNITADTYIEDASISSAKIKNLSANQIQAGVLSSLNKNTKFNLNTGSLDMENASFYLSSGASIRFLDSGNTLTYSRVDSETNITRTAGVGVGTSINSRFPVAYLGTTGTGASRFGALDDRWFTGFITNTNRRMDVDGIGNSVVGQVFHVRDKAVSYSRGFRFDISTNTAVLHGLNTGSHSYHLGRPYDRFARTYTDNIYGDNITFNYHGSGSSLGYIMENTVKSGRNPAFRPQYGGEKYYDLGTAYHVWRNGYINTVRYKWLTQRSMRKYKEDIKLLDENDAINYIKTSDVHTFYYKDDVEKDKNIMDMKVGIMYDDISLENDYLIKASDDSIDQSNIVFMVQAATKNILGRTETLEEKYAKLEGKVERLEKENKELREMINGGAA
ncbi:hypothetical protein GCM10008931_42630 [Oceanobacillus oncorhynchi subsp. oncorhynchi]|uniref:hypothetical protein n=1 Tax=Oceanobacillus oncorhynchi TaxID=545501 RepID=UPI0031D71DB8